jgi:hypothetical protein
MKGAFFAKADDAHLGSFHYPLGLVDFTLSDPAHKIMNRIFEGGPPISAEEEDEDRLVQLAYEVTSFFHEMRHFVDAFGTIAGISLFSNRLERLKDFAALAGTLRSVGMHWKLPIGEWAQATDCPKVVRDFVRRARAFNAGSEVYISPFEPVEIDGHVNDLKIELDYECGGKADAFPIRFNLFGQDGIEKLGTVLFPIGLETLMEGNAHAICRTFVESYFPAPVAQRLQHALRLITSLDEQGQFDQRVAQTTTPYMVCELLISRALRRRGIGKFPRSLVLAIIDKALGRSLIRLHDSLPGVTEMHVDRVGTRLVQILESEAAEVLAEGAVSDDPGVTKAYEKLLAAFEAGGDWQSVEDTGTPASSIAIWESYVAKAFIVPLLRERLETGHRAFTTYEGIVAMVPKIGLPPARVANGNLMLSIMPPRVQQAWWHHLMLGEIFSQLARGGTHVFCPRAHATVPGITTMNLALRGDCEQHLRLGCGTFRVGHVGHTPECLFEDALRTCALQR